MQLLKRLLRAVTATAGLIATLVPAAAAADVAGVFTPFNKGSLVTVDHAPWDALLKAYVVPAEHGLNRIAYARLKRENHGALKTYIKSLEATDVRSLDRPEQFAFWANLYNAKTLDVVLDKYPVGSIKSINLGGGIAATLTGGPWKAKIVRVGDQNLSLDDIEHVILRGVFKDPRVHYAVNCASVGCPNVADEALTGAKLEAQLEAGAKAYVNSPRGLVVRDGKLTASSIYNWFQADFGGSQAGVLAHVRGYAEPALRQKLDSISAIDDFFYDWSLNDAKA